jgi:hypothetical protein
MTGNGRKRAILDNLNFPINQKKKAVTRAEPITIPATVANKISEGTEGSAATMEAAATERMATGVSWGRLTIVEKGLNRPVTRQRAAAPKIHIPAARGAKGARAPEKIILAKETSTTTRTTPIIKPCIIAGISFGEITSPNNSLEHLAI